MSNIHRWPEFEDWVEFYTAKHLACVATGKYEAVMNFGGPGAAVNYHFYARVHAGYDNRITGIEIDGEAFTEVFQPLDVKGTPTGYQWVHLGWVKARRDYRRVTVTAPDGLAGLDRLSIIQIPLRLESGEIERRIALEGVSPEPLSGVPLGGVGAGKIELCRDGLFQVKLRIAGAQPSPQ